MAFHVACPITCHRICFCSLGFPRRLQTVKGKDDFLEESARVEEFYGDPWLVRAREGGTVQVAVPKVVPPPPPAAVAAAAAAADGADAAAAAAAAAEEQLLSAQTKRAAMQRKAAAASLEAEDLARRIESGEGINGEEQGQSSSKVLCRLCYAGENEGSERARKMLSCKSCGKKYHRSCLKTWAHHRDLFHWSSWTCLLAEFVRSAEELEIKLGLCSAKGVMVHTIVTVSNLRTRCYCNSCCFLSFFLLNVSNGPYLCPKHTRCHSCGSNVPGNGLSVRWFLGYTCCDACGRLFVKGNYCPVCLKVYRDSESTPMVCCDDCQRWVHCHCDGISDEKYMQFQADGNLQYKCATCRGECYQVRDLEDAVQELWRRKDHADRDLIKSLRAAAGLPTQEEIFSISPYSDDEEYGPTPSKNEYGRSLKFSLKGVVDKSPKKSSGKKSSNKKYSKGKGYQKTLMGKTEAHHSFEVHSDGQSCGYSTGDNKDEDMQPHRSRERDIFPYPIAGSLTEEGVCSVNQAGHLKHRFIDEVTASNGTRAPRVQIKRNRPHGGVIAEETEKQASKSNITKGPKLVIHLGARAKNAINSPRSDASSCQREQDLTASNGSEDMSHQRAIAKLGDRKAEDKMDLSDQVNGLKFKGREGNFIKIKKGKSEVSDKNPKVGGGKLADGNELTSPVNTRVLLGKRSTEGGTAAVGTVTEVQGTRGEKVSLLKHGGGRADVSGDLSDDNDNPPSSSKSLPKDPKPFLKLKFKNRKDESQSRNDESRSLWAPHPEDERSFAKGQRSKRKRPSPLVEKASGKGEEDAKQWHEDNSMDEIMEENWILLKLGKDAVGKRVEVHQLSNNSWHKGTVTEFFEDSSTVSVALDDGRAKNLDLKKQGVRFVAQKQKRGKELTDCNVHRGRVI
ncbi:hypothetical protein RJ639_007701 [Escallonia herrerae]|uniref:PHD-type domain-containing protein n=1 Tax=Escallonia herrerae TaxID=1293975 RepID=A0AA88VV85_9ASTE|nr:hypothetical protein RJ639_007701 [Escallonia herrerae]